LFQDKMVKEFIKIVHKNLNVLSNKPEEFGNLGNFIFSLSVLPETSSTQKISFENFLNLKNLDFMLVEKSHEKIEKMPFSKKFGAFFQANSGNGFGANFILKGGIFINSE